MKKFIAIYIGSPSSSNTTKWEALDEATRKEREKAGMNGWMNFMAENKKSITDVGCPVGNTKQVDAKGISDTKNKVCGYTIVEAESHEAAAKLFLTHPHFSIFPGDSVEVMECLPVPGILA